MNRNNYILHLVPKATEQECYVIERGDNLSTAVMTPRAISSHGKRVLARRKFVRWLDSSASAILMTVLLVATVLTAFYWLSA